MTPGQHPDDDGPGLLDFLPALWRYRIWIAAGTLVIAIALSARTWTSEVRAQYEATARLIAMPSKVGEYSSTLPHTLQSLRMFVDNQSLAGSVVSRFKLDKPPYSLTPARLMRNAASIVNPRDTSVLEVHVILPDAQLAATVANGIAEEAVRLAIRLSQEETAVARDLIGSQVAEAQRRFADADAALLASRKKTQLEMQERDVNFLLTQRRTLGDLLVQIEVEKARLEAAEKELARQERVRNEKQAVSAVPDLAAAGKRAAAEQRAVEEQRAREEDRAAEQKRATGDKRAADEDERRAREAQSIRDERRIWEEQRAREEQRTADAQRAREERSAAEERSAHNERMRLPALEIQLRPEALDPYVNPVYAVLADQVARSKTTLAALERQRNELSKIMNPRATELAPLTRLYASEAEVARLETEHAIAKRFYQEITARYEQARMQVAGRSAQLQILDPAQVPEGPLPAGSKLRGLAGNLAIGFVVSSLAALAFEFVRRRLATSSTMRG